MSLIFDIAAPVVDVCIILIRVFIGCCWIVVIYRAVSLGGQLDILPLPSSFPHYPSLSSASTSKEYWLSLGSGVLFFISLIEVLFSIYYFYLIRRVQVAPHPESDRPFELMKKLYFRGLQSGLDPVISSSLQENFTLEKSVGRDAEIPSANFPLKSLPFDHPKAKDFRENQRLWFRNCRWEDIYRENLRECLCLFLFNKTLEQVKEEDKSKTKEEAYQTRLEELLIAYERRAGTKMPDGYNESLKYKVAQLPQEAVKVSMRPFTLTYGVAWTSQELICQIMKWNGFKLKQCFNRKNGLKYLIRIPDSWRKLPLERRPPPLIFIHGMGSGFLLYVPLITYLTFSDWSKERPVMILIQPHISMQIYSPVYLCPPNKTQIEGDIKEVFQEHGFNHTGVELLAHSNGTVVAGWIMKSFPWLISRSCFLDPVCFVLWEGNTCYNFFYSKPKTGLEKLIRFGLGEELGIAWYTRRNFHWPDMILWPEEIPGFNDPKRFKVVLAGKDAIINASRVRQYLIGAGMSDSSHCDQSAPGATQLSLDSSPSLNQFGSHACLDSSPFAAQSTKPPPPETRAGGIIFDPHSAHGQTMSFGHPCREKVIHWLQDDDTMINHNTQVND